MSIREAFQFYQKGQLAQAAELCQRILRENPQDFSVLHLMGLIALQNGEPARAAGLINQSLLINATDALAWSNYSAALIAHLRFEEALGAADRAIALKPDFAGAHNNRANALRSLEKLDEALASYDRAIELKPDLAEAHDNRGGVLSGLGRLNEALQSHERALALWANPKFHNNRAILLERMDRPEEALASWDAARALAPDVAAYHHGRAGALRVLKRCGEALAGYDAALRLDPTVADAHSNRGVVLNDLARHDEALAAFDTAILLKPTIAATHNHRGASLDIMGRHAEAAEAYARAIALKPDFADAHMNLGMAALQLGEVARGWQEYEWRWKVGGLKLQPERFTQPKWTGAEPLEGKTILLHNEQGLGDALHFVRYAKLVAALGGRVVLEVQKPLVSLLTGTEGVHAVVARGDTLPAFDFHSPLLSLPLAFGTTLDTIPADIPYLKGDPALVAEWRARLGEKTKPRIGLTWSGNAVQKNDGNRSMTLATLMAHLPPDFDYVSLQKDVRDEDRQTLAARSDIRPLGETFRDFSDTAAVCELMDAVVTVCTSTAHLSAGMGKPTFIALCFNPCWRWMLERTDSPWYPSARLYRQAAPKDWTRALKQLGADLGSSL